MPRCPPPRPDSLAGELLTLAEAMGWLALGGLALVFDRARRLVCAVDLEADVPRPVPLDDMARSGVELPRVDVERRA